MLITTYVPVIAAPVHTAIATAPALAPAVIPHVCAPPSTLLVHVKPT